MTTPPTHPIPAIALQHAERLTETLQATGRLTAERYGHEILTNTHHGIGHMSERVACRPDDAGVLRWHWSWGKPINGPNGEPLTVDDLPALAERIGRVVGSVVPRP